jgi:tripartite-type tricarboxylate transporter receptor subunit TctC
MRIISKGYYLLFSILLLGVIHDSSAQNYPNKPIHLVVSFAPGGTSDLVARVLQFKLGEALGQPIIIENKPGASGNIGLDYVAKAAPDGYTIYLGNIGALAINPSLLPNLKINTLRDLTPITLVADLPGVLAVPQALPVNNIAELTTLLKANPGKFNFASPGSGSVNRLQAERYIRSINASLVHVPYKGGAGPASIGLVSGETEMAFLNISSARVFLNSGKLKGLAITTTNRLPEFPNIPTVVEVGYPELVGGSWTMLAAPAGTPKEIINKIYNAAIKTLSMPEIKESFDKQGAIVITSKSPEAAKEFLSNEIQKWSKVVKEVGVSPD